MKKQLLTGVLASTIAVSTAIPAMAQDIGAGYDLSMNAGVVSNYLWRGVSQSRDHAAMQGGIDLKHSSGVYAGTWMSSVKFDYIKDAYMEQDLYAGYGVSIGKVALDLRYTEYHYPGIQAADFSEWHTHVSAFGATIGVDYSDDTPITDAADSVPEDVAIHYYGNYTATLPAEIGVSATVGEYDFKDPAWVGSKDDAEYTYYTVGVSKSFGGVTFGASYTDTNMGSDNCVVFAGDNNYCDESFVLSVSKAL